MGAAKAIKKAVKKMPGLGVSEDAADVMFPERWYDRGYDEREEESSRKVGSGLGSMLRKTAKSRLDMMPTEDLGDLLLEAREDGKWGGINTAKEGMFDFLGNTLEERAADYGGLGSSNAHGGLRWANSGRKAVKKGVDKALRLPSDFYDIPRPTKACLVVENTPFLVGHVGIVFEDDENNTIGYQFGSWKRGEEAGKGTSGEGRMIVEKYGYHRYEKHGGIRFELDMTPEELMRLKEYFNSLEQKGNLMEKRGDLYDKILRKVALKGDFSKYDIFQENGGKNCVSNVLAGIQYAYAGNEEKRKYFEKIERTNRPERGNFQGLSPHVLAWELKRNRNMKYTEKRRSDDDLDYLKYRVDALDF